MRKIILLTALFLVMTDEFFAQQSRREVISPANPPEDSKLNSESVPPIYTITAKFDSIVVCRLKFKIDLLEGLKQAVKEKKIMNAVILAGTGSVRSYQYHAISNDTFPTKNIFVKDNSYPADIVSMNGYVINGRVHAHVTFSDADKAFGGHLEPGTEVFTFAIITLGVLNKETSIDRIDDKNYR